MVSEIRQISNAAYKEQVNHGVKRWASKVDAPRSRLRITDAYFGDVRESDVTSPSGLAFAFLNADALGEEDAASADPALVTTRRRMDGTFTNNQDKRRAKKAGRARTKEKTSRPAERASRAGASTSW